MNSSRDFGAEVGVLFREGEEIPELIEKICLWYPGFVNTGPGCRVDTYLASSLTISHPSAHLPLKLRPAFPQPVAGQILLLQKHGRVWLLTRGMQAVVVQGR